MIEKGEKYWNGGLTIACYSGHTKIVKLMIEKGANLWSTELYIACSKGYIEIAKIIIEILMIKNFNGLNTSKEIFLWALKITCEHGYTEIIKLIIEKYKEYCEQECLDVLKKFHLSKNPTN